MSTIESINKKGGSSIIADMSTAESTDKKSTTSKSACMSTGESTDEKSSTIAIANISTVESIPTDVFKGSMVAIKSESERNEVQKGYANRTLTQSSGRFRNRNRRSLSPRRRDRERSRSRSPHRNDRKHGGLDRRQHNKQRPRGDVTWAVRQMFGLLKRLVYGIYLRPGSAVVDFGHGPGTDQHKFAHARISSLTAVDFVQEALEEAAFRAKTNPRFVRHVRDVQFVQQDLCRVICRIDPPVDTVTCQFALHYMWQNDSTIHTILTSVRDSLKSKGHFIITIVDADRIPAQGIHTHPFITISPPINKQPIINAPQDSNNLHYEKVGKEGESQLAKDSHLSGGRWSYRFTFPGLVENVEEYVIPAAELISNCRQFSLEVVATFTVRDKLSQLLSLPVSHPDLSAADWQVLDLYRCYVFQKI